MGREYGARTTLAALLLLAFVAGSVICIDESFASLFDHDDKGSDSAGVAGLGPVRDRESLESDVETVGLGSVHRPGSPHRPPSPSHSGLGPSGQESTGPAPYDRTTLFSHHINSFFNSPIDTDFFSSRLPGFNLFDILSNRPWWEGENICTEREEKDEEIKDSQEWVSFVGGQLRGRSMFGLSMQTCIMKQHKYVCTAIKDVNGRRHTTKLIRQCCHGYGRPRSGGMYVPCEKLDLQSMEKTAEQLGAKEFIATLKKSGLETTLDNTVTLFVVPDGPYSSFAEQMWENNLVAFDPMGRAKRAIDFASMTARDVILAHTVNGSYHIEDVQNEELLKTDLPGVNIRINIYPRRPTAVREQHSEELPFRYTANCAPLVTVNRLTESGIVHVVDRVLVPARNSLMEIIEAREDMTLLRAFLEMTGLDKMLREKQGAFTIFAPSDDAFMKLDKDIRRKLKAGNGCAMNILKNHILDLTFCSMAALDEAKTSTTNMLNERLEFEYATATDNESLEPVTERVPTDDISTDKAVKRIRINGKATIQETDVMASNGVLHVIDTVLPTDSGMPISATLDNQNLTIFKQLLVDAGLEDEFDEMSNRTFFIPSDQAFEQTDAGRHWIRQLKEHPENLRNNAALREFVENHVVEPLIKSCELQEKMALPTKAGQTLRVNLYRTHQLFPTESTEATVNCARVVQFNEATCGSVVHQIDRVLDVPKMNLMEALAANPEYSMFLSMVRATNLTELLSSDKDGLSLLVPKNDVFLEVNDWYQQTLQNKEEVERIVSAHILPNVVCCTGIGRSEWPFRRTTITIGGDGLRLNRNRRPEIENAGITKCDIVAKNGIIHEINDVINVQPKRDASNGEYPFHSFGSLGNPLNFFFK